MADRIILLRDGTETHINVQTELRRVRQGKKPRMDMGMLLLLATDVYPAIQGHIMKAFDITN